MNYDWFLANARKVSPDDLAIFARAAANLPLTGRCPYGSRAHNLQVFRLARQISGAQSILEIGFNRGYGAALWLELGCSIVSMDLTKNPEGAFELDVFYGHKFNYVARSSESLLGCKDFDLAFIDGDHELSSVKKDIDLCKSLEIPWMLFDDFDPIHGPGVQPAIIDSGLKMVALIGNMALCHDGEYVLEPKEA